jgi:hypothetical protein
MPDAEKDAPQPRRRTEAEARKCSRAGCPGDGRYQPPGRGHLPGCEHNAVRWVWEEIAEKDAGLIEWRERIGVRLMLAMTCTHEGDQFGPRAVCGTCFDNVQRVGEIVQAEAARAWDLGRAAERRDWEFTADLATPDEDREPWTNPYRFTPPHCGTRVLPPAEGGA